MSASTWSTSSVIILYVKRSTLQMPRFKSMVWYFARRPGRDCSPTTTGTTLLLSPCGLLAVMVCTFAYCSYS